MKEVIKKLPPKKGSTPKSPKGNLYQFNIEHPNSLPGLHQFLQEIIGKAIDTCYVPTDNNLFTEGKEASYDLRVWLEPGYYLTADCRLTFDSKLVPHTDITMLSLELSCYWYYPFEQDHLLLNKAMFTDKAYWFEILTAMHSTLVTDLTNCLMSEVVTQ